jgi:hypothetical protein
MDPVRIRVTRIMDFGTIVSVIGVDFESGKPITVHIDHRPFADFWNAWKAGSFQQPVSFDAEDLTLSINMAAGDDDGGELLSALPHHAEPQAVANKRSG